MEYMIFVIGVVIILFSLFLSYRSQNNNDDNYYLETEILSEIREIKSELSRKIDNISETNFTEILDSNLDDDNSKINIRFIKDKVAALVDDVSGIKEDINRVEMKLNQDVLTNRVSFKEEDSTLEDGTKSKIYQEIKKLLDEGLTLAEIAKKLDMGNREVELIWKLNSRGED